MIENLQTFLENMLGKPESELVEFKLAGQQFSERSLWNYFSALANEANLRGKTSAYLILGINPKTHLPEDTRSWSGKNDIRDLKNQTHKDLWIGFREIYDTILDSKRILIFEIPPAPHGTPIASNGFFYARAGESLVALDLRKLDEIRSQGLGNDWSGEIVSEATLASLDPVAIKRAKDNFKQKHSDIPAMEIDSWRDEEFLNRAKILKEGRVTRTALILLWKPESTHFLSPSTARISWVLKDATWMEKDYMHFEPPFLLTVDLVAARIRNLRYRYMQEGTIFPEEIDMYDSWVIRELLHNCIAHQDYTKGARISVVEFEDGRLIFANAGKFMPSSVESVIASTSPPPAYRNAFLANAMVEVKMIDTIGSGIKRIFDLQSKRYFPLPTYNLAQDTVEVELIGKILDIEYVKILSKYSDLSLLEIIVLDKIQKWRAKEVEKIAITDLKNKWLVEGRYPNIYFSWEISAKIWQHEIYVKNRPMHDDFYKQKIFEYIKRYHCINKDALRKLLLDMFPDFLDEKKKEAKIHNLIQSMKKPPYNLESVGPRRNANWVIKSNDESSKN